MWLQSELKALSETFQSEHTLEDFLPENELNVIKENATRYANLKNGLIIPRHNAKVRFINFLVKLYTYYRIKFKTITLRHLCHNFDLHAWLTQIGDCLKFNGRTKVVWVGYSFMMHNSRTDELAYVYAARELCLFRSKPRTKVGYILLLIIILIRKCGLK